MNKWNINRVESLYIHILFKSTQQFSDIKEKFLQWNNVLEEMNKDNQELLDEKFPTLDAPATVESLFPLRGVGYFETDPDLKDTLDWGIVEELYIR